MQNEKCGRESRPVKIGAQIARATHPRPSGMYIRFRNLQVWLMHSVRAEWGDGAQSGAALRLGPGWVA